MVSLNINDAASLDFNDAASIEEDMPGLFDSWKRIERREATRRSDDRADESGDGGGGSRSRLTLRDIIALVTLLGMAFTAGANWHRIDALTDEFNKHVITNEAQHATFAHQDVVAVQQRGTDQRFEELRVMLQQLLDRPGARR